MGDGTARRGRRVAGVATGLAGAAAAAWSIKDVPAALGARPATIRSERVRRSPQFRDGKFRNTQPASTIPSGGGGKILRELLRADSHRKPSRPIPVVTPDPSPHRDGLAITWYSHASSLVEIEGRRILLDPVWSQRCSPSAMVGPRRLHPMPLTLADLPEVDAVLISHDHYDHLDLPTVRALTRQQSAPFLVPLGVGAHFARWGVPADRVVELDWGDQVDLGGVTFTLTEAQHFSGRGLSRDDTLWGSWVIERGSRRVFYSGDTGFFPGFAEIGTRHGPFDATIMQVGAYAETWPDIHLTPEDGVRAHLDLRGGLLIPVHWCSFVLAFHSWSEPVERIWREAKARAVALAVPRPGQRIDVDQPPEVDAWWQEIA